MSLRQSVRTFGIILTLTLLIRLPFIFQAVIDWDESTFILIGQSILDGHLPYVHLWDVKPPLLFAFFAAAIAVFGHTIEGIRIAGALCVAVTAWFVFKIADHWWGRSPGWLGAFLCVLMSTLIGSGQATMSEHVMLPALMGAVYLWIRQPASAGTPFWVGALMAAATLVRLNMAYAVLVFGLVIGLDAMRRRTSVLHAVGLYGAGGLTVVAATCLPFAITGQLMQLWKSAVVAALARADSGALLDRLAGLADAAFRAGGDGSGATSSLWLGLLVWPGAIAGLIVAWRAPSAKTPPGAVMLLTLLTAATAAGIVTSGGAFGHYFIQLIPFASIATAVFARHPAELTRRAIRATAVGLTFLSLGPVAAEYRMLFARASTHDTLRQGAAYDLSNYLTRENAAGRPVLLLSDHVAYWLMHTEPPTGFATHPSTLSRGRVLAVMGTTPRAELTAIFRMEPAFVVIDPQEQFLEDDDRAWLDVVLARDYLAVPDIAGRKIFRRKAI